MNIEDNPSPSDKMPTNECWALLGASRGLGFCFAQTVRAQYPHLTLHLFARRPPPTLGELSGPVIFHTDDFSNSETQAQTLAKLDQIKPQRVFYFAGGGPYGPFHKKNWKDHQWALEVSLLFPMRLAHHLLASPDCCQLVLLGSSVAESKGDAQAASYCAAKHGLMGLWQSLRAESEFDLRLYSPGYMDTDLVPLGSKVRKEGALWSKASVAVDLLEWSQNPHFFQQHRCLPIRPDVEPYTELR